MFFSSFSLIKAENVGGGKVAKIRMVQDEGEASSLSLQNLKDGVATYAAAATTYTCVCDNVTFEEAAAIVKGGDKLDAVIDSGEGCICLQAYYGSGLDTLASDGSEEDSSSAELFLVFAYFNMYFVLYWTADGITLEFS